MAVVKNLNGTRPLAEGQLGLVKNSLKMYVENPVTRKNAGIALFITHEEARALRKWLDAELERLERGDDI